jgi:predicted enzyme related to lactoylglutathione lyase
VFGVPTAQGRVDGAQLERSRVRHRAVSLSREVHTRRGPGNTARMTARFYTVIVDAQDPAALARFWADVLDWKIFYESDDEIVITTHDETFPGLVFGRNSDRKTTKNRLHIDLAPDDQDAEVERILALGATRADVGQSGDEGWVVLADPEGNEFCVLSAREGGM